VSALPSGGVEDGGQAGHTALGGDLFILPLPLEEAALCIPLPAISAASPTLPALTSIWEYLHCHLLPLSFSLPHSFLTPPTTAHHCHTAHLQARTDKAEGPPPPHLGRHTPLPCLPLSSSGRRNQRQMAGKYNDGVASGWAATTGFLTLGGGDLPSGRALWEEGSPISGFLPTLGGASLWGGRSGVHHTLPALHLTCHGHCTHSCLFLCLGGSPFCTRAVAPHGISLNTAASHVPWVYAPCLLM